MDSKLISEVADLALMMYEESPYDIPVEKSYFEDVLRTANTELFVAFEEDKPVGFILGAMSYNHHIWGSVAYAVELAWYVHPDYRSKGHAVRLLENFESWARIEGAQFILNAAMSNDSFEQVKAMYESRGYKQADVSFIKEIK